MNKIKTIIRAVALIAIVSASTGCLDNFEDYNRNPNEATDDELERDNYLVGSKLTKLQNMVIPSKNTYTNLSKHSKAAATADMSKRR